jgi:hypothetical protein
MQVVAFDETKRREVQTKEYLSIVNTYYGTILEMFEGPQVFLVNMPNEGSTIHPHFHDVDQFQVIVGGSGRLGPGAAAPVAFHYADAFTPYGPIVGAKDGISFFTIRANCANGYYPMPEARNKMKTKPGRNIAGNFDITKPLPAAGQSSREKLLEAKPDNVLVVGIRMGAKAVTQGEPTTGGDQYYLVCTGSLIQNGKEAPANTLIRLTRGEAVPTLTAGPNGANVLLLQLPMPTDRIGSDPKQLAERSKEEYALPPGMIEKASTAH